MIWISILIILLIVLAAIGIILYINRKMLLRDITSLLNKVFKLLNESHNFSKENAFILDYECQEIKKLLFSIENTLAKPPKNKDLENFLQKDQEVYKDLKEGIKEKKANFSIFIDFKEELPYIIVNIQNKTQEIRQRGEKLIWENEELGEEIREKVDRVLFNMEELINEYKTLDRASFNDFNFYILEDLDQDYLHRMDEGNNFLKEIGFFYKELKISLEEISRKSKFYITLEENEEEKRGKKRIKEILVSYKTFKEASPGKAYDRKFTIAKKRAITTQTITLKLQIDEDSFVWQQELTNKEFAEFFNELKIPFTEDQGEDGLPLEIERDKLNTLIGLKKPQTLEIEHETIFFQELNIYEVVEELLKTQLKVV